MTLAHSPTWRITMSRLAIFTMSLLAAITAHAGSADLSFTYATKNTDGTDIPATCSVTPCGKITSTVIEYGTCAGTNVFGVKAGQISVAPPATTATVALVVVQTYCFRAAHITDFNQQSAFTNVVSKVNAAPVPNAPGGLAIANSIVYQFIGIKNGVFMNPVGSIAADVQCDATQTVNGYQAVPRESVNWYGKTQPQVVFAKCS